MPRPSVNRPTALMRVAPGQRPEPVSAYDHEVLNRYKVGSVVEVSFRQKRSNQQNRLYWWALGVVAENNEHFDTAEKLSKALLLHLGHVDRIRTIGGQEIKEPISLTEMDKEQFSKFIDEAMVTISTEIIPGLDIEALLKEGRIVVGDHGEEGT